MTGNQEPPGPRKSRRLGPEELARDLANRLKSSRDPDAGGRRFLPHFDMLNAGRLILGLGALLILAVLVAGFSWLSGMAGYQTTGTVIETSPVYGCPGEPELGKVFEGEEITVIGRNTDRVWLAVRDNRGPGNVVYVLQSVVTVDGDESLLSTRECEPVEGQPVAAESTAPLEESTVTIAVASITTTPGETTTTQASAPTRRPPRRSSSSPGTTTTTTSTRPGATTTTTRPGATTTTRPTTTTTRGSTTTSSSPTTTSSSTTPTTQPSTTTTSVEETTTTTVAETTTTAMP